MKKLSMFAVLMIVCGIFILFYDEKCEALAEKEYMENMVSNIDTSYHIVMKQVENIHTDMKKAQVFFEQDPSFIAGTYEQYYTLLTSITLQVQKLDKYVSTLQLSCEKIGTHSNNQCVSYKQNLSALQTNYQELLQCFNITIEEYNFKTMSTFKTFGD